jgi:hypothetical protein
MKARRKDTKKTIEVEVLRPRMYRQKDKHGRVVEDFEEDELELLQELTLSTSDHWQDLRERAAIAAMHAFCVLPSSYTGNIPLDKMAQHVVKVADALVKELKGE